MTFKKMDVIETYPQKHFGVKFSYIES